MLLFFDVDGTLWDYTNTIRDKTKYSIRTARANGHKCFINTGRSRGFVTNRNLLDLGFDGIVSSCGTMIEYNGKIVFNRLIPEDDAIRTIETVRKYGFRPILEGPEYLYMERADFEGDMYGDKVIEEMGERLLGIDDNYGKWEINKLSCATDVPEEKPLEGKQLIFSNDLDREESDVMVESMVRDALIRLNPEIAEDYSLFDQPKYKIEIK